MKAAVSSSVVGLTGIGGMRNVDGVVAAANKHITLGVTPSKLLQTHHLECENLELDC